MRSKIATTIIGIAVCLTSGMAQSLRTPDPSGIAPSEGRRAAMLGLAPDPAETLAGGQHSPQTVEDLRTELLSLADTIQKFAVFAPHNRFNSESLQLVRAQIQQMPAQSLNALRAGIDPARLHARLQHAQAVFEKYSTTIPGATLNRDNANLAQAPLAPDSPGFPNPDENANESCISIAGTNTADATSVTRYPTAVILAADLVWQTADSVRELAQDACKQEVVVAGEGGNTSLVCTVADGIWIVAKFVDFAIHFCDDDLTGAVGDASYLRLGAINDSVGSVQGSVNNVSTAVSTIGTQVSNVGAQVTALDTHLTTVEAHLTTLLGVLQASVDLANQRLLKSIAVQTELMKLVLTPEGQRVIVPSILTCTGSDCPTNLLSNCTGPGGACTWNNVGPLP